MTKEELVICGDIKLGNKVIDLLSLPLKEGRVATAWGTKVITPQGLGAAIRRLVEENNVWIKGSN